MALKSDEETTLAPTREYSEPDDHDKMAHYVEKEALEKAILDGIPCMALCGKMWLPTRDAKKFPVCPECKEIWEGMEDD